MKRQSESLLQAPAPQRRPTEVTGVAARDFGRSLLTVTGSRASKVTGEGHGVRRAPSTLLTRLRPKATMSAVPAPVTSDRL